MYDMYLCLENYGFVMWFNDFNKLNYLIYFWGFILFIGRNFLSVIFILDFLIKLVVGIIFIKMLIF